jgi:hypothetical protein
MAFPANRRRQAGIATASPVHGRHSWRASDIRATWRKAEIGAQSTRRRWGSLHPVGLAGIHINMPAVVPRTLPASLRAEEQAALDALSTFFTKGSGYAHIQGTRPQSIGYALADSPVGQAAWI